MHPDHKVFSIFSAPREPTHASGVRMLEPHKVTEQGDKIQPEFGVAKLHVKYLVQVNQLFPLGVGYFAS